MNKVILSLLLAVCVLGMGLIMLNEPTERKPRETTESSALSKPNDMLSLTSPQNAAQVNVPPVSPAIAPTPTVTPAPAVSPTPPAAAPTVTSAPAVVPQPALPPPPAVVEQPKTVTVPAGRNAAAQPATKPATTKSTIRAKTVTRFTVVARDTGATVHITGSSPITYKTTSLQNPERIAVDLDGQWDIKAPGVPKNSLVTNVRLGKMPDKTRIVIDLKAKPKNTRFVLSQNSDSLDIRLDQ